MMQNKVPKLNAETFEVRWIFICMWKGDFLSSSSLKSYLFLYCVLLTNILFIIFQSWHDSPLRVLPILTMNGALLVMEICMQRSLDRDV
jgi:hypothetical protein